MSSAVEAEVQSRIQRRELSRAYAQLLPSLLGAAALFLLLGWALGVSQYWSFVVAQAVVIATIVLSLTLLTATTGQISLAQSAFAGAGAYTCAHLESTLHLQLWATLPLAIVVGFLLGVIVGIPALRLSGVYLAISTFGLAAVANQLVFQLPVLGGVNGVSLTRPTGPIDLSSNVAFARFCLAFLALLLFVIWRLRESPTGWALQTIRDNERAAAASGVDVPVYKLLAFGYSGAVAAVGGGLFGYNTLHVNPLDFSAFNSIVYLSLLVVIGGSLLGALVAGALYVLIPEIATNIDPRLSGILPFGLPLLLMAVIYFSEGNRRGTDARGLTGLIAGQVDRLRGKRGAP